MCSYDPGVSGLIVVGETVHEIHILVTLWVWMLEKERITCHINVEKCTDYTVEKEYVKYDQYIVDKGTKLSYHDQQR